MTWVLLVLLAAGCYLLLRLRRELLWITEERDDWRERAQRYYDAMGDAGAQSMGVNVAARQFSESEMQRMAQLQRDMHNSCTHGVRLYSCPICAPVRL